MKFALDIQLTPYCEDVISETQEEGQFYVGTDHQFLNICIQQIFVNPFE